MKVTSMLLTVEKFLSSVRIFGKSEVLGLEARPRNSHEQWAHKFEIQVLCARLWYESRLTLASGWCSQGTLDVGETLPTATLPEGQMTRVRVTF